MGGRWHPGACDPFGQRGDGGESEPAEKRLLVGSVEGHLGGQGAAHGPPRFPGWRQVGFLCRETSPEKEAGDEASLASGRVVRRAHPAPRGAGL